ncbi:GCRV-induced gene 2p [Myripristis murdjan]|nr:uncharacterized protein LOC115365498 [Myripristis murdjan]
MSVSFFGWEVTYDDASHRGELGESQEPKDKGVYTMYHGTSVAAAKTIITSGFQQSTKGMLGKGVYVSRNQKKAERYPLNSNPNDRVVLELRVHVGRVKRIDKDNHPMQYTWNANGYDTAWVPPKCGMMSVPSGLEEDCVFDPSRVEVTGIARAADGNIQTQLQQLIAKNPRRPWKGKGDAHGSGNSGVCPLCKRKILQGHTHTTQQCWGCGQNICILMTKHVCPATA